MKRRDFIRRSLGLILCSTILKVSKAPTPEPLFKDPKDVDWKQFYNCGGNKNIDLPDVIDISEFAKALERPLRQSVFHNDSTLMKDMERLAKITKHNNSTLS